MISLFRDIKESWGKITLEPVEKGEIIGLGIIGIISMIVSYCSDFTPDTPVISKLFLSMIAGMLTISMLLGLTLLISFMVCMVVDATIRIFDIDVSKHENMDVSFINETKVGSESSENTNDYSEHMVDYDK